MGPVPDESIFRATLDAVDVGVALVGPDGRIEYANPAYGEFVANPESALEGTSIFGVGCPCAALEDHALDWDESDLLVVTGRSPQGTVVDVVVCPVTPGFPTRLVVVRRGLVRAFPSKRLPAEVVRDLQDFLAELTGHAADPDSIAAAPLSILMLGVEDLPALRTRLGDDGVEEILRQVAQALVLQKRKADIISRYGDSQFLVLAPDTPRQGAAMLANRIRERVEALRFESDDESIPISLVTYAAEYRPSLDGSIREAVTRACEAVSSRRASEPIA